MSISMMLMLMMMLLSLLQPTGQPTAAARLVKGAAHSREMETVTQKNDETEKVAVAAQHFQVPRYMTQRASLMSLMPWMMADSQPTAAAF